MDRKPVLGWPEYTAVAIGIVVSVGVAAIISPAVRCFFSSDVPAAWVQAVGSIAAIVGSFALGRWQSAKAMEQAIALKDAEKIERLKGYESIVELVYMRSWEVGKSMTHNIANPDMAVTNWQLTLRQDCIGALGAFAKLPLHELHSPECITSAAGLGSALATMVANMDAWATKERTALWEAEFGSAREQVRIQSLLAEGLWNHFCENSKKQL
jgi:hypothetical protein